MNSLVVVAKTKKVVTNPKKVVVKPSKVAVTLMTGANKTTIKANQILTISLMEHKVVVTNPSKTTRMTSSMEATTIINKVSNPLLWEALVKEVLNKIRIMLPLVVEVLKEEELICMVAISILKSLKRERS